MDIQEVTYRTLIEDEVDEDHSIYVRELLKYAFECFMKGEYYIVSKDRVLMNEKTDQLEFIIKMSYIDKEYMNLFEADGWLISNFSDWKFENWLNAGCIPPDRIDEYLKIFESKNLV